jgi:hypothetical protein
VPQFFERHPLQHPLSEPVGQLWHARHLRVDDAEKAMTAGQGDESVPTAPIAAVKEFVDRPGARGSIVGRSLQERKQRRAYRADVLGIGSSHRVAIRLYGGAAA